MHTTSYDNDIHFIHNGDYSGDVIINLPTEAAETTLHNDGATSIKIPYEALEYLVTQKLAGLFLEHLEDVQNMNELFDGLGIRLVAVRDAKNEARYGFVRALAALDNPDNMMRRRTQTLQEIIDQAKELLK